MWFSKPIPRKLHFLAFYSSFILFMPCTESKACGKNVFRSFDGSCNNEEKEEWGQVGQVLEFQQEAQVDSSIVDLLDDTFTIEPETPWTTAMLDLVTSDIFNMKENTPEGVVNLATPFLDLSNLYGTPSSNGEGGNFLAQTGLLRKLAFGSTEDYVGVIAALYLLSSEHKRLVGKLSAINPGWDEVKVEHEARKIVIAQYQHVVVSELMPVLVGQSATYFNEIQYFPLVEPALSPLEVVLGMNVGMGLQPDLTKQEIIKEKSFEDKMKLMLASGLQRFEAGVAEERIGMVLDLVRMGRRLGVDSWKPVTEQCGLSYGHLKGEALDEHELKEEFIDALLGGLLEVLETDGLLRPTMACVLRQIVEKLISSDRLWYHNNQFSNDQLDNIQKITLASIICSNIPSLDHIQPNVFLQPDDYLNANISCEEIPQLNLDLWIQEHDEYNFDNDKDVDEVTIDQAIEKAEEYLVLLKKLEQELNETYPAPSSRGYSKRPSEVAYRLNNNSAIYEFVTNELLENRPSRNRRDVEEIKILNTEMSNSKQTSEYIGKKLRSKRSDGGSGSCRRELGPCNSAARYRTFSGRCNNLKYPDNGSKDTIQNRLLTPVYQDGVSKAREFGWNGFKLPNPRTISQEVHKDEEHLDIKYTMFVMQWGQFVDHDLTKTPFSVGFLNSKLDCAHCQTSHPECLPIPNPPTDNFWIKGHQKCIEFTRSLAAQQRLGPREQLNAITAYLDSSQIYGSDECEAKTLRSDGGHLAMTPHPFHKSLLPETRNNADCRAGSGMCFLAGDERVNEQPGLTSLHTMLVREHNLIVDSLNEINPHWNDERLFQEARRIVVAENQHITYNEFLPRVLGRHFLKVFSLDLETKGYFNGYHQECSAGILNEFSTAAYRFGHSLIRGSMSMMGSGKRGRSLNDVQLRDHFHNPEMIRKSDNMDQLLRGLLLTPMEQCDSMLSAEVTNHLFEKKLLPFSGMDLAALNIMRGRDHGIPSYTSYRKLCKLQPVFYFNDLLDHMEDATVERLRKVYDHVNDIDLFTGGLSERRTSGAMVGPTFACIIGLQFSHLRKCDRFWYENDLRDVKFSEAQLQEIRGSTVSALICRNADNPHSEEVPRSGFDQVHLRSNPMVNCMDGAIKQLNLEPWRENTDQSCTVQGQSIQLGQTVRVSPCLACRCNADGQKCETIDVENCLDLVKEFGVKAVQRDKSCFSQCIVKF